MNRNKVWRRALIGVLVVMMVPYGAFAQDAGTKGTYSKQELDQMLASIALYPDSLLAQILIAATYPDQIAEANRWVKQNSGLNNDQLNDALDKKDWDLSVKALVPFTQVLDMMVEESDWTKKLGDAFLAQQADVIDSIQKMRVTAKASGNLKTSPEQKVEVKGESVEIEPADPEVVTVPSYDPQVVYGNWWWPDYPPFLLAPFAFIAAVIVGPSWNWGWGHWNWRHRDMEMNIDRMANINSKRFQMTSVKTASLGQLVSSGKIGTAKNVGKLGAGKVGVGGRPSADSLKKQLSGAQTGLSKGDALSRDRDIRDKDVGRKGTSKGAGESGGMHSMHSGGSDMSSGHGLGHGGDHGGGHHK